MSELRQVRAKYPFLFAGKFIVIPGYPPADHDLRDFLTADLSRFKVYDRVCAFLEALFDNTAEIIEDEFYNVDPEDLASEFRRKMTEGQTYRSVNDFRKTFYDNVIMKARVIEEKV